MKAHVQCDQKSKPNIEFVENKEPVPTRLHQPDQLQFIFLVERSDTMQGPYMKALKDALQLFLERIPFKCKFTILSFGCTSRFHTIDGHKVVDMNEENLVKAIRMV